jgi:hypothetical protein
LRYAGNVLKIYRQVQKNDMAVNAVGITSFYDLPLVKMYWQFLGWSIIRLMIILSIVVLCF